MNFSNYILRLIESVILLCAVARPNGPNHWARKYWSPGDKEKPATIVELRFFVKCEIVFGILSTRYDNNIIMI